MLFFADLPFFCISSCPWRTKLMQIHVARRLGSFPRGFNFFLIAFPTLLPFPNSMPLQNQTRELKYWKPFLSSDHSLAFPDSREREFLKYHRLSALRAFPVLEKKKSPRYCHLSLNSQGLVHQQSSCDGCTGGVWAGTEQPLLKPQMLLKKAPCFVFCRRDAQAPGTSCLCHDF